MKWLGIVAALAGVALVVQGLNSRRLERRKEQMLEARSTARKLEKATFAAG